MKNRLIFIHIPKCGGTSLYPFILDYNKQIKDPFVVNYNKMVEKKGDPELRRLMDQSKRLTHSIVSQYPKSYRDSCFVFSFVRNPYDRLLSAHKYLTDGFGNVADKKFGKTLSSDFKYFVKNQLKNNMNWLHFRPMKYWLSDDIDFIGKTENFQQDFNIICDKVGVPRRQLRHRNKSKHKHYTEYYDDATKQIVSEIYAKDIEYFDYKFGE